MCLLQCFLHHLRAQTADLDIHLQGGDALGSAGDFEIHIAEVVFGALDIGQDLVTAGRIGDQAHGHTGDRGLDRHTCIHQRQGRTADGTHRGGSIGGECLGYDADGVGEGFFRRDDRFERTLCQCSMTNLAPALSTKRLCLTGGVGREVIVVQVALVLDRAQVIEFLCFAESCQRGNRQDLRLAAGEQTGAVGTW